MISVLIATRNRPGDLVPCLRTVLAVDHGDFEVIVVDQSDTDDAERGVRAEFGDDARVCFIRSTTIGKSAALNALIEAASGDILAFTDDDTEVPGDWLKRIERAFERHPEADVVFGQVLPGPADPGRTAHMPSYLFNERRFLKAGDISGMGANMAMRRSVRDLGLRFDRYLGPGAPMPASEEGDFVYRAQAAGVRVLHDPDVTLVHRATRDSSQWLGVLYSYGVGDAGFAAKHLRCGDLKMIGRIAGKYGYFSARLAWRLICRRKHEEEFYLRGYRAGIRASLRHRIDRRTRLYAGPKETARAA